MGEGLATSAVTSHSISIYSVFPSSCNIGYNSVNLVSQWESRIQILLHFDWMAWFSLCNREFRKACTVGSRAFPVSGSVQLVPVYGVNFCWYNTMELELSLLVAISLQCELGEISVHVSALPATFRLCLLQLLLPDCICLRSL